MRAHKALLLLLLIFFPLSLLGQIEQAPYERVLIPVLLGEPVAGAFGSQWTTDLVIRNESDEYVWIIQSAPSGCVASCQPTAPPHTLLRQSLVVTQNPNPLGNFLYIGRPGQGKVSLGLRVQDVSRQASTWGTAVPIVQEKDVFTGKLQLLNVPINGNFRAAIRVYDFDTSTSNPTAVRMRVYEMCGVGPFDNTVAFPCNPAPPLVDTVIPLQPSGQNASLTYPSYPGVAFVADLTSAYPPLAQLAPRPSDPTGIARVRIDLDPVTPGLRIWAFASVTHNETQHVTVITPN